MESETAPFYHSGYMPKKVSLWLIKGTLFLTSGVCDAIFFIPIMRCTQYKNENLIS